MSKIRNDSGKLVVAAMLCSGLLGMALGVACGYPFYLEGLKLAGSSSGMAIFGAEMLSIVTAAGTAIAGLNVGLALGTRIADMPDRIERHIGKKMPGWDISITSEKIIALRQVALDDTIRIAVNRKTRTGEVIYSYYDTRPALPGPGAQKETKLVRVPLGHRVESYVEAPPEMRTRIDMMIGVVEFQRPGLRLLDRVAFGMRWCITPPRDVDNELYAKLGLPLPGQKSNRNNDL